MPSAYSYWFARRGWRWDLPSGCCRYTRRLLHLALYFLIISSSPATLFAQRIRGVVRDDAAGSPLPGAVIIALSADDSIVGRATSDGSGAFVVALVGRVATRIRALRIGYRPAVIELHGSDSVSVLLSRLPSLLDTTRTKASNDCPASRNAPRAAALWEQVRAAFVAASAARETSAAEIRVVRFHRILANPPKRSAAVAAGMEAIASQTVRTTEGLGLGILTGRRSPSDVAAHGYMTRDSAGHVLYPPDEGILIDDAFTVGHCFDLQYDTKGHAGEIGITFIPVAHHNGALADVGGTPWFDSTAAELRTLDYSITNTGLTSGREAGPAPGGLLTFAYATNGAPLLAEWTLRQPAGSPQTVTQGSRVRGSTVYNVTPSQIEDGGVLARAQWSDGTSWSASLPAILGVERWSEEFRQVR